MSVMFTNGEPTSLMAKLLTLLVNCDALLAPIWHYCTTTTAFTAADMPESASAEMASDLRIAINCGPWSRETLCPHSCSPRKPTKTLA